ncbi:alpha/beta hydrolase [Thermanaerothrix sp. 4228-RoL]|jgi:pimeloyl-ACP methyl ester carboxylesterase|uniref:Alpha/beta hydrolase n=1 Tax=Thermanaerothrix solaris TaxID=3058434 RepID=A0ABU3NQB7_9CHLR|nr:alpha/beta hydrolase [Thermanaerothrix sp. 4228-RoL]MDT8899040.1 alpha/beta hydrolase [Thermanaerothrix sp. 4228-RoL]
MALKDLFLEVQGLTTHLFCMGEGEQAILLLHGGGVDSARLSWEPIIPALAKTHRVYAPDLPGYGDSAHPDIPYTMAFYIDFVTALLDTLNLTRVTVAGVSMGGGIAIGLTLTHPERVQRLIPVDSYGLQRFAPAHRWSYWLVQLDWLNRLTWWIITRHPALAKASLQQVFYDPRKIDFDLMNAVWEEVRKPHAGRAFRAFQRHEVLKNGLRTVYLDRLNEIKVPTLFVHGEHDRLVPLECAYEAHRRLSGSQLTILPQCGHWPQRENPSAFIQALMAFLSTIS